jgi:alkyl sulfatase BDS1-like metallo-beta-lactamase superfamily hydrolase
VGAIRETAEKLWSGALTVKDQHPLTPTGETEEIANGVAFIRWFANVVVAKTAEGLVLIDTGAYFNQDQTVARVRHYSPDRINTAIYTHGHVDHACGMPAFLAESQKNRHARPKVVGHRSIGARFDRYKRTRGYNNVINTRQFGGPSSFPEQYVYPDTYYDAKVGVIAGGEKFDCYHARGETDDHTWVHIASKKLLCTGDLFIWAGPNAGNPQKVQRYAREWAEALRAMAKLSAEVLAPGHGSPIFGARNVRQALNDTATYLEKMVEQTSAMMNAGATLEEIIHTVKPPSELAEKPYLQPVYDEPEFLVRNIWRLDGGWYDGIPSHLKPAPEAAQGREIASLAGGIDKLISRAAEKLGAGELELACHLIDWAVAAAPSHKQAHRVRMEIYSRRADESSSTMSHGIFRGAALDSAQQAGEAAPASKRLY